MRMKKKMMMMMLVQAFEQSPIRPRLLDCHLLRHRLLGPDSAFCPSRFQDKFQSGLATDQTNKTTMDHLQGVRGDQRMTMSERARIRVISDLAVLRGHRHE